MGKREHETLPGDRSIGGADTVVKCFMSVNGTCYVALPNSKDPGRVVP